MTRFIAISNRKGGVGKTTLTLMTAYGFALYGLKRVLVIDLDAQASSSLAFLGAERWIEAKETGRHAGDMFINAFGDDQHIDIERFITRNVGDVTSPQGELEIDIIPSSSELDDSERGLLYMMSRSEPTLEEVFYEIECKVARIIRSAEGHYDIVILDCPPGLSCAAWGGLRAADFALVPYTPDPTAEDNIRALMKNVELRDIETKFIPVANRVTSAGQNALVTEAIEYDYGKFGLQIPARQALVNALTYNDEPVAPTVKFGNARGLVENLHEAILLWMHEAGSAASTRSEFA